MSKQSDLFTDTESKACDADMVAGIGKLIKSEGVIISDSLLIRMITQVGTGDAEEYGTMSRTERKFAAELVRYAYASIRRRVLEDME